MKIIDCETVPEQGEEIPWFQVGSISFWHCDNPRCTRLHLTMFDDRCEPMVAMSLDARAANTMATILARYSDLTGVRYNALQARAPDSIGYTAGSA